jgi:hypothetical protein
MMGVVTLLFIDDDDAAAVINIIITALARIEHLDVELESMLDAAAICSCCHCCYLTVAAVVVFAMAVVISSVATVNWILHLHFQLTLHGKYVITGFQFNWI